jgi:transcriptional regulator with XRE-family HTH domain
MIDETMTLAELRRKAGYSRSKVATRMGASETAVTRLEAAYPQVRYDRLREYLRAIDYDVKLASTIDEDKDVWADYVVNDPSRADAVAARKADPSRMGMRPQGD